MPTEIAYPAGLPCPMSAPLQRAERRGLSSIAGPRQSRVEWTDRLSTQSLDFIFKTGTQLQTWLDWYHLTLHDGAGWFAASWPQPEGGVGVRRFVGAPSYPEYLSEKLGWRVSAQVQIRGRGVLPTDDGDEFWSQVLLHLNADDISNFKRDWSVLDFATGINGSPGPALNTAHPKFGPGCIDLTFGEIVVAEDHVYSTPMGSAEFTLQWWTWVLSYPVNANDRIAFFGAFNLGINPAGGGDLMGTEINDLVGGGRTEYAPSVPDGSYPIGQWVHSALTRTNDGIEAHIDIFIDGEIQTPSSTFSANSTAGTTGFSWVGGGGGTSCLIDDFQLTAGVNRYRGLTSFTPPGKLPTH